MRSSRASEEPADVERVAPKRPRDRAWIDGSASAHVGDAEVSRHGDRRDVDER